MGKAPIGDDKSLISQMMVTMAKFCIFPFPVLQFSITPPILYSTTPLLQYSNTPLLHYSNLSIGVDSEVEKEYA